MRAGSLLNVSRILASRTVSDPRAAKPSPVYRPVVKHEGEIFNLYYPKNADRLASANSSPPMRTAPTGARESRSMSYRLVRHVTCGGLDVLNKRLEGVHQNGASARRYEKRLIMAVGQHEDAPAYLTCENPRDRSVMPSGSTERQCLQTSRRIIQSPHLVYFSEEQSFEIRTRIHRWSCLHQRSTFARIRSLTHLSITKRRLVRFRLAYRLAWRESRWSSAQRRMDSEHLR